MRSADFDLLAAGGHRELVEAFEWDIPAHMNIASEIFDRWAGDRRRVALYVADAGGGHEAWSYWQLIRLAKRYANFLASLGVRPGDRVGLVMPQGAELAALHLAVYAIGAIALPMSNLYGPETYRHILTDSGARVVVVDARQADRIRPTRPDLGELEHVVVHGEPAANEVALRDGLGFPADYRPLDTSSADPALLLYTSGSTGHPKGALHAHRILEGYMLTFRLFFNVAFDDATVFYTPSDWAWVGGLLDILLPALLLGHPVVADDSRFSAERSFEVMGRYGVTHAFFPPTALKRMAQIPNARERHDLDLRVIASGGEAVADDLHRWSEQELGAVINEFYGLTEVNHMYGGSSILWPGRPGWMGLAYPGRTVAVLDSSGVEAAPGEIGEIGVRPGDPTQMLGYWGNPEATEARVRHGWIMTGDQAVRDADGYVRFLGRDDDMISSAGYRIGPAEVEECILAMEQVAEVAVIAADDTLRGQVVRAVIVLADGFDAGDELAATIQNHVKRELAAYKYPRIVDFVADLPKTTTGKINRKLIGSGELA